ncbi:hypothetical protein ACROYT_G021254 [Oculina patagonica]
MALRCVSLCDFASRPSVKYLRYGLGKHCIRLSTSRAGSKAFSRKWNPFTWYNEMLDKYPIRTKCITSGVLYGVGDYIAQKATGSQNSINDKRLLRAAIYGSIIMAPLAHVHFNFLEWLVVKKIAARASLVPFVKMFFDQFGYWSPIITAVYHVSMGAMEGLSYNDTMERLKELYWPTLKACWMIWPMVMVVNFKFVPIAHQLNFCLAVSLVWATILSVIRAPNVALSSNSEEIEPADIIPLSSCSVEVAQR